MLRPEVKGENDIVYTNAYGIEVEKNTSIQNNSPLIDILLALKEPIVREELELKANFDYSGQIEKEKLLVAAVELAELEAALCIPLISRGIIIGLLNLGSKKPGKLFSPEELDKLARESDCNRFG